MEQLMRGMTAESLPSGVRFVRLHYSADPLKNQEWAEAERKKEADPRNWDVQMEMRRVIVDGYPIFPRYSEKEHAPESGHNQYFPVNPRSESIFYGGWDAGQTLNPAFVLLEFALNPVKVRVLLEVVSLGGEDMGQFAPRVKQSIEDTYPQLLSLIKHFGDPTIQTRSGSDGLTAQQVAKRYGFDIQASTNQWEPRRTAVAHLLTEIGMFELCKHGCPVLHRGFIGQYRYKVSATGDKNGAGAVLMTPLKNAYSHVQDALQYPSIDIYKTLMPAGSSHWDW